jgi:putative transposase
VVRQCRLLGISRSGLYYQPVAVSEEDLALMKMIDCQCLTTPFYGARRLAAWLRIQGYRVNRKRVLRLMQVMGLKAIYRRPRTSTPAPGHRIYPYLLSGMEIAIPSYITIALVLERQVNFPSDSCSCFPHGRGSCCLLIDNPTH